MKQIQFLLILFSVVCIKASAQDSTLFPKGEIGKNTDNYTGTIWLNELSRPDSNFTFGLAQAVYAPGSKLDWHIHPGGQYLLITEGTGYYQEKGSPVRVVHKGDIIKSSPGTEHWHGAVPNSRFAYVAVTPITKGKTIWLKRVTDKEYNSIGPLRHNPPAMTNYAEEEITSLSGKKWKWMAEKSVDSLDALFDEKSMFVHMGGTWGKTQELKVIKSGDIWYRKAEIYSITVNIIGNTAILLSDIDLEAVVGGNTVTNPFMVIEVYINENGKWKMGSLTFSRLLRPVKMNSGNSR